MRDVVFVLVILGFFALAAGYVRACARIIGPDEVTTTDATAGDLDQGIDAGAPAR